MNENLKNLRISLRLTQEAFANSLGVKRGVIAQIETGKNAPTTELLSKIKSKYNVDILSENSSNNYKNEFNISEKDKHFIENEILLELTDFELAYRLTNKQIKDYTSIYKEQIRAKVKTLQYISSIAKSKVDQESYRYSKLIFNIEENERIQSVIDELCLDEYKFENPKLEKLAIMINMRNYSDQLSEAINWAVFHLKNALEKR